MERLNSMKPARILISGLLLAGSALLAAPAVAQVPCPPAQQCANGVRVPFPIVSPVQGLNSLAQRLQQQRQNPQQQPAPVPWNYAPVATPPQNLPPDLQR